MIDISNTSSNLQQTIGKPVSIKGIGLHTGAEVTMKLFPAKVDYGIKFIRKDIKDNNVIEALWSNVSSTKLSTTISNQNGISVSTVEHLMSALSGLHIDNIKIEIDGPEVPIMDGSSIKFVDLIDQNTTQSLNKRRKILKVKKNIKVVNNDSSVELKPNDQFSIDFEIDFDCVVISIVCDLSVEKNRPSDSQASAKAGKSTYSGRTKSIGGYP